MGNQLSLRIFYLHKSRKWDWTQVIAPLVKSFPWVISSHKSTNDRQYNDQMKTAKRTRTALQYTTQTNKIKIDFCMYMYFIDDSTDLKKS